MNSRSHCYFQPNSISSFPRTSPAELTHAIGSTPHAIETARPFRHKRTFSDVPDVVGKLDADPQPTEEKKAGRHIRSYSQTFDLEAECAEDQRTTVGVFRSVRKERLSRGITEEDEEDSSESEEIIRKIIRERARNNAVSTLRSSISHLISVHEAETRKRESERIRLKKEVLNLVQREAIDSSRVDTPETVVTIKSSQASVTTVIELFSEFTDSSMQDCSSEETAIPVEEQKSSSSHPSFDEQLTETTVISASPFSLRHSLPSPTNHHLIRSALAAICLPGEANRLAREEITGMMERRDSVHNFVIAFRGAIGRQDLGAVYEHDQSQCVLVKIYGPQTYPAVVEPRLILCCYRYDPTLRTFHPLQFRRLALCIDAVSLQRRLN